MTKHCNTGDAGLTKQVCPDREGLQLCSWNSLLIFLRGQLLHSGCALHEADSTCMRRFIQVSSPLGEHDVCLVLTQTLSRCLCFTAAWCRVRRMWSSRWLKARRPRTWARGAIWPTSTIWVQTRSTGSCRAAVRRTFINPLNLSLCELHSSIKLSCDVHRGSSFPRGASSSWNQRGGNTLLNARYSDYMQSGQHGEIHHPLKGTSFPFMCLLLRQQREKHFNIHKIWWHSVALTKLNRYMKRCRLLLT